MIFYESLSVQVQYLLLACYQLVDLLFFDLLVRPMISISIGLPTNSADRQSLQFAVNKIIYKIFGLMAKDSYSEITEYFGIPTVEHLITNRHDRFLNRYRCQENYVCQALIT